MARKGLNEEIIIDAATDLIAEKGYDAFSLHALAAALGIKTASLYNHISGSGKLVASVGERVLLRLKQSIREATEGKEGAEAVRAMVIQYRNFARENPELYQLILLIPELDDADFSETGRSVMYDLYQLLKPFHMAHEDEVHFGRTIRSAMHGFISLEQAGFFKSPYNADASYQFLVESFTHMLEDR